MLATITPPTSRTESQSPFTDAEIQDMHRDDRNAATAIIGIMVTIFLAAVIGYTVVAWIAAG